MFFFTYETELPPGVGFSLFGPEHLAWLGGLLLFGVLFCFWFLGQSITDHHRISRKVAWFSFFTAASFYLILFLIGHLTIYHLPLHLCTMAPYLCLLWAYKGWDWIGQTLYAICLPGAVGALLFPNWSMYPQWNFLTIHSYLLHGALVLFIVCQLLSGLIRPRPTAIWKPCLFLAVITPPIYLFNARFGTNFLFVNAGSEGSPLEGLYRLFGQRYLIAYALLVLAIMAVMYAPWRKKGT